MYHDHAAEVYINGNEAGLLGDWRSGYVTAPISQAALNALVIGENTLAAHCSRDDFGEQYFDLGVGHFVWQ